MVPIPGALRGARRAGGRLTAGCAAADLAAVIVFVVLGRLSHHEDSAVAGAAVTAWPFLTGLALGWGCLLLLRLGPLSYRAGLLAISCTVVFGMLLRHIAHAGNTPLSFLIVASCFVTTFLLGWRVLARLVRRRAAHPAGP